MNIEEAKDILLNIISDEVIGTYCIEIQKEVDCSKNCEEEDCYLIQAIDTVLSELEKKDKLIDKLAEHIAISGLERSWTKTFEEDVEDIKKMFTNKVEKEGVEDEKRNNSV